jgi:uncharacterized surface protein with fasciclin (FAS1) repeats
MKMRLIAGFTLSLILGFAAQTSAADQDSIYDYIASSSNHTILASAITETRQTMLLNAKDGKNTFFAPTDEAFKKLGEEQLKKLIEDKQLLKKIVLAHLVAGEDIKAEKLKSMAPINGFTISVNDGLKIGEAKVIKADLPRCNGIIHVIDTVLIPSK